MALINQVESICQRLGGKGWAALFKQHGLDLTAPDLATELARPLSIDRTIPGFEDFALEGVRGIEPGVPARSLLFHAFASMNSRSGQPSLSRLSTATPPPKSSGYHLFPVAPL